jgi:hypothetical protein
MLEFLHPYPCVERSVAIFIHFISLHQTAFLGVYIQPCRIDRCKETPQFHSVLQTDRISCILELRKIQEFHGKFSKCYFSRQFGRRSVQFLREQVSKHTYTHPNFLHFNNKLFNVYRIENTLVTSSSSSCSKKGGG